LYKFKIADFFDSKQKFVQKNRGFATFYEVLQHPPFPHTPFFQKLLQELLLLCQ